MKLRVGTEKRTIFATILLLVVFNLAGLWLSAATSWVAVVLAVGLLLLIARKGDLSLPDIGISKTSAVRGLLWGAAAACIVLSVMLIVYAVDRTVFLDSRYHNQLGEALLAALLVIPLHTVIIEELAFRGVLLASLNRMMSTVKATLVSSVLFGLWHVVPSLHLGQSSNTVSGVVGEGLAGQSLTVAGIVGVTTLAGIAFCELRRRSDSLIAPIMAHWAINGVAVMLAALAWAK